MTDSIETGDLYQVSSDDLWSTGQGDRHSATDEFGRNVIGKTNFKLGEILEVRYPYEWHVRTIDNKYFHITPEDLSEKCKPYGKIKEKIRFGNKHCLKEILEEDLYYKAVQCVVIAKDSE